MPLSYDAVLLIAFGGPTGPDEIRPFLARVLRGVPIPPERLEDVVHHYEAVGGKSPLNEITFRQAEALQKVLQEDGVPLRVYVGMRNARPFFSGALKKMMDDGVSRALGFILSSHQTEASWERYQKNIADARTDLGKHAPEIDYCESWYDHPLFIETWAELIEASLSQMSSEQSAAALIFTAHSLPVSMAERSPYVQQVHRSSQLIAQKLGQRRWFIAYQSRSGRPTDPWLEPDLHQIIHRLGDERVPEIVVAPIGFVCDHVEILYDLDIEAKKLAESRGLRFFRAHCPNDHATFIRMMENIVKGKLVGSTPEKATL